MTLQPVLPLDQPRPAMPAKRAAEILGCDLSHVYKLLRRRRGRRLEGYRDGRAVRVFLDSVAAYQRLDPIGGASETPAAPRRRTSSAAVEQSIQVLRELGCL